MANPCPICLDSVKEEAYLDRCLHKFCYQCITKWANWTSNKNSCQRSFVECPVCKRQNFCIIHGCDGDFFQQHHLDKEKGFALTEAHKHRLQCYSSEQGDIYQKFDFSKYWRFRRYLQPNTWLECWLRREIQALIQEGDVDVIVHHILGIFDAFVQRHKREHVKGTPEQIREEWLSSISDTARPFLLRRTDRFVKEVELFLVSGLNITAYDDVCLQSLCLEASCSMDETPHIPALEFLDEDFDRTD